MTIPLDEKCALWPACERQCPFDPPCPELDEDDAAAVADVPPY